MSIYYLPLAQCSLSLGVGKRCSIYILFRLRILHSYSLHSVRCKHFTHSRDCIFTWMMLSLAVKKLACFMRSCIFILVLMPVLLDSLQKVRSRVSKFKHSPYFLFLQSQDITSCVAILDSRGIQFWSSEMWLSSLILLHVINWFDQHHLWKRLHFLHVRYWLL